MPQGCGCDGDHPDRNPGARCCSCDLVCGECYSCTHGNYHICNNLKVIGCQADGAAQEYFVVNENLVVKFLEDMSYDYGAMVEPAAVGVHAVGRLGNVDSMNILVLGAGPIGNLTAQSAKGLGAKGVLLTDISDYRLQVAKECGVDHTVNVAKQDLEEFIDDFFGRDRADAILECVGIQDTIEQAIQAARKGSDIIVVGVYSERPTVDLSLVQDRELRLIGTLMYKEKDYQTAIDLIQSRKIRLNPLISKHFPFKEYEKAYRFIEENREHTMKVIIDMEE